MTSPNCSVGFAVPIPNPHVVVLLVPVTRYSVIMVRARVLEIVAALVCNVPDFWDEILAGNVEVTFLVLAADIDGGGIHTPHRSALPVPGFRRRDKFDWQSNRRGCMLEFYGPWQKERQRR
ncbi:hypothetical protein QBC43DRAFT_296070 [Cladorrhinum sp. PSN259]|nr:hypothetical protein QBC43DRAFT_296070 [Cladorrhinum sp. PSN259]